MGILYNQKRQNHKRRILRNESPTAEKFLWQYLKGKQIYGYKFRRQFCIGIFVLDFYCPSLRLAIEIDGPSHDTRKQILSDKERQEIIEEFKITFIRFKNAELYNNIDNVIEQIKQKVFGLANINENHNPLLAKEGT